MCIRCPLLVQVRSHGGGGTRPAGECQDPTVSQSHQHFMNRPERKDQNVLTSKYLNIYNQMCVMTVKCRFRQAMWLQLDHRCW